MPNMEVCVDSVESAVNAEKGGATRIELCSNLVEGGTTPSIGMLQVVKQVVKLPVFAMVRPRGGDFLYTEQEVEVMEGDIRALKQSGVDGIVLGALNREGEVDMDLCQELIDAARPLPITFHRAIDMAADIQEALECVIKLNCERVLTSGGDRTALDGAPVIRRMVEQAGDRIIVVPAGGITERNLRRVLDETGAKEFHTSARRSRVSQMTYQNHLVPMGATFGPSEFNVKVTDRDRVKSMLRISHESV